jgi:hypothetical protein
MKDAGVVQTMHKHEDGFCALRELIKIAEDRLVSVFEQHTLADLMRWQDAKRVLR